MGINEFARDATTEDCQKWQQCVKRERELYQRDGDPRSPFARDYNRILHCTAYRRLKHKTQVFFATDNDHVCTRIEHVNHVAAISRTISKALGLNTELTDAVAIGHDLGHAPFGHEGESVLTEIAKKELSETFWHEKNSMRFVDKLETLTDPWGKGRNLSLTYAVRDGIISHCGEVKENVICPRDNAIDLNEINAPNQYQPFTWEGCVVKVADKIAYLGRDIEDALLLKVITVSQIPPRLRTLIRQIAGGDSASGKFIEINNTVLIHSFIMNLCNSSGPTSGIRFSDKHLELMNETKQFNYDNIYNNPRLEYFKSYAKLMLESIYGFLSGCYSGLETLSVIMSYKTVYPLLTETFTDWLTKYTEVDLEEKQKKNYENQVVYAIDDEKQYLAAVIDYISGMTDSFAIKTFDELTSLA